MNTSQILEISNWINCSDWVERIWEEREMCHHQILPISLDFIQKTLSPSLSLSLHFSIGNSINLKYASALFRSKQTISHNTHYSFWKRSHRPTFNECRKTWTEYQLVTCWAGSINSTIYIANHFNYIIGRTTTTIQLAS